MRGFALGVVALFVVALFSGCIASSGDLPQDGCAPEAAILRGLQYLDRHADPDGGIRAEVGLDPDPRTTAWVLIAAALARRAGQEGVIDPEPHLMFLREEAGSLLRNGSTIDSVPNNLSLARAAFQTWGLDPFGVRLPGTSDDAATVGLAWESHYDASTGRYGERLNEHLFGHFAALLSEPEGERRDAMRNWVHDEEINPFIASDGSVVYLFDAWYSAYARLAVGPSPSDDSFARELDRSLVAHKHADGGVRGFAHAERPDASSTAAALMAWAQTAGPDDVGHARADPDGDEDAPRAAAAGWLCENQASDGRFPFDDTRDFMPVKTTAEAVIALALHVEPIPM